MTDYQKYINALRKCAKEHENDRTSTGHIIVSDLCRDTANLLEQLEQEPAAKNNLAVTSQLEKNSKNLENSTKKYCGCCKHWKIKGVKKIGDKPTSYGKCNKLSISGFEVETKFNDNCRSDGEE